MTLTKKFKEEMNIDLIEKIKKRIGKLVICPSVKKIYKFLMDNTLLLEDCTFLTYSSNKLTRANFYGKQMMKYATTYGYRGQNPQALYIVCNRECKMCSSGLKCALDFNGYIYPNQVEHFYKETE